MDEFIERFVGLGTFEIVSGEMYVTDPLFELDTECVSALKNVRSGRWNAAVYMVKTGGNVERVSRLAVWHEDAPEPDQLRKAEADFEVPVDAGQAGFFDTAHYRDSSVIDTAPAETYSDGECVWFDRCCEIALGPDQAGVLPFGAVSTSGYGDDVYPCVYYANEAGEILRAELAFITEEDFADDD